MISHASRLQPVALIFLLACGETQAYVPPGPKIPVRIESQAPSEDKHYLVTLRNEKEAQSCAVPCSLDVSSGTTDIAVHGALEFQTRAIIPAMSSTLSIRGRKNSQFYTGVVMASLFIVAGSAANIAGLVYDNDKQPGRAILSYGVSAGLYGVALIGSIVARTAGKNRVTIESLRAARSPADSTAAPAQVLANATSR